MVSLRPDPADKGIRSPCASGILIAHIADTYAIGFIRWNFAEPLIVMGQSEDDDPTDDRWNSPRDIQRIHDGDPDIVCLVREGEALDRLNEFPRRRFIACLGNGDQFGIGVGPSERLRRSGAFARVLARQQLQVTPRMLIWRVPEKSERAGEGRFSPTPLMQLPETRRSATVSGCGAHVPRFGRRGLKGSVIAGLTIRQDKAKVVQSH